MRIIRFIVPLFLALIMLAMPMPSFAGVFISVGIAPPPLPVYEQPLCPEPGYIWTPGYWAYGPEGYFWVPGTWVLAPEPGFLWTPGYWGWGENAFIWHAGFWGPHVGFYGGVNYGFGYFGEGYQGGYWRGRDFYYNRTVNNVNVVNVRNVYNTTVINNNTTVNRVSYNGGTGGIEARPTPQQEAVIHERHIDATPTQTRHVEMASSNRQLLAAVNHGRPAIAATVKPAEFKGRGTVAAKAAGAPYNPPANRAATATRGNDRANNDVRRPGNTNVARPENSARENSAPRPNNVPRPPSASNRENAPRQESTPVNAAHSQAVPRPPSNSRPENAPRQQSERRPQNAPRPQNQPPAHNETGAQNNATRPQSVPRPQSEPRMQSAPHPQSEPRMQQNAPHAEAAPRPENNPRPEKESRPAEERPHR